MIFIIEIYRCIVMIFLLPSRASKFVSLLIMIQFSDAGCLFTCGDGSYGQLGHGDCKSYCSPVKVSYFDSRHVDQVACGMRHSLVLLKGKYVINWLKCCSIHAFDVIWLIVGCLDN